MVLCRSLHYLLHIGFKLLGADVNKAGFDALDAPFFKLCKEFIGGKAIPPAGIGEIDTVDIEDNAHIFFIGVVADGRNVHIGLESAGGTQLFVDVKALSPGVEHTLAIGKEGLVPFSSKILL